MPTKGRRDIKRIIPAGESDSVAASGEFIYLKSSTGELTIEIDKGGASVVMEAGDKQVSDREFKGFFVTNNSGADVTVIFVVGYGDFTKGTLVGTVTLSLSSSVSETADQVITTGTSYAIAANTSRRKILLSALSSNTGSLRVTETDAAGRGIELMPGMGLELETTGAMYVRNDTGGNQTIGILELE